MNGKSKLHIRPRCVGIMSSRVWPSLSLMLRCCHQSVINITVLAPWQTTHSVKLDTISDLNKQMNCCIWIHFVMYNPRCYIPKCICAEVCYKHHCQHWRWGKSTLSRDTGGGVMNTIAGGLCPEQYSMTERMWGVTISVHERKKENITTWMASWAA